jgi:hypothetical protein
MNSFTLVIMLLLSALPKWDIGNEMSETREAACALPSLQSQVLTPGFCRI